MKEGLKGCTIELNTIIWSNSLGSGFAYLFGDDLGLYFLSSFVVDPQFEEGSASDKIQERGEIDQKFLAGLDVSEVLNVLKHCYFGHRFNEPLSQDLLCFPDQDLALIQNFFETAFHEKLSVSVIAEICSAKEHYQQLFGLDIGHHEDVPHFERYFLLYGGIGLILHAHKLFDGDHGMLLKVMVERPPLILLLSGARTGILGLVLAQEMFFCLLTCNLNLFCFILILGLLLLEVKVS